MKEALENSGTRKDVEIFDATREEISGLKDKTEKEIDAQITEAKKYIKAESEVLAVSIMERILDRRLIQ
jgi:F-type H+-transporting ATPase subunit b